MTKIILNNQTVQNTGDLNHKMMLELSKLEYVAAVVSMAETMNGYMNVYSNGEMLQYDPVENAFVGKHGMFLPHEGWVS